MSKADIALIISLTSLLISAGVLYLHFRRYRSETKPRLKVDLAKINDHIEIRALNSSQGPVVIESFGFEVLKRRVSIRMYRHLPGSPVSVPDSMKLEQNEPHVETISTTELSAILEEELNLSGSFRIRGLYIDSLSKAWRSAQSLSIDTGEWWPPENGRRQTNKYGEQLWRNVTIVE